MPSRARVDHRRVERVIAFSRFATVFAQRKLRSKVHRVKNAHVIEVCDLHGRHALLLGRSGVKKLEARKRRKVVRERRYRIDHETVLI